MRSIIWIFLTGMALGIHFAPIHAQGLSKSVQTLQQCASLQQWPARSTARFAAEENWVIGGNDPVETVTLTGSKIINRNIVVLEHGMLIIDQADVKLNGDILIANHGKMRVKNSRFTVVQEYIYEHEAIVVENGSLHFENVEFQSSGQSWSVGAAHEAEYLMEEAQVSDGYITTTLMQDARASIQGSTMPGEFLCFDNSQIDIANSSDLLMWLLLPAGSDVNLTLPDGKQVQHWQFAEGLPGVTDVASSVSLNTCTDVLWGLISMTGSRAVFRDTDFRTVGLMFHSPDSVAVSNITNQSSHADEFIQAADRTLRLINTDVQTWNFYASKQARVYVENVICGEILAMDTSYVRVENSVCDGSGGYVGAFQNSFMLLTRSLIQSQIISRNASTLVTAVSALQGSEIDADESSVQFHANSQLFVPPEAHANAILFQANIPFIEGCVDQVIPVEGTVRILKGPENPIALTRYKVEYRKDQDTGGWQPMDGMHTETVVQSRLAEWNTMGLSPGNYGLKLTLYHTNNDSLSMESWARLDENMETAVRDAGPDQFYMSQNYPNPFNPATRIDFDLPAAEFVSLCVFDATGRHVKTLVQEMVAAGHHSVVWQPENQANGLYTCRFQAGRHCESRTMLLIR